MMTLYSGTTDPFSQRCRIVLHEKGMDFQIIDVDMYNKPEDIAVMNPYNRLPVLVERDLILYEANIINEYIDERFPHPQLMPADPVMRARARLFLFQFEKELFDHIESQDHRYVAHQQQESRRCGVGRIFAETADWYAHPPKRDRDGRAHWQGSHKPAHRGGYGWRLLRCNTKARLCFWRKRI